MLRVHSRFARLAYGIFWFLAAYFATGCVTGWWFLAGAAGFITQMLALTDWDASQQDPPP